MERERTRENGDQIARDFARLAAAEARLSAASLSPADAAAFSRLRSDIAAGLVLLLSWDEGSIGSAALAAAAAPLELAVPANVMARLPAAARLAALDLASLADGLCARLAAGRKSAAAGAQNEKPRRRQGRPRLELVVP